MAKYQHPALVMGLFDTGVNVIRCLARTGIPVIGIDFDHKMPGFKSRYCISKICPHPIEEEKNLLNFLIKEAKNAAQPLVIFPTSDIFVYFVSRNREVLRQYFKFILPSYETIDICLDKRKQYETVEQLSIPYPKTFYPNSIDDIATLNSYLTYPVFIKPYHSYMWMQYFSTKGFKVYTYEELRYKFLDISCKNLKIMIQQIVPGPVYNNFEFSAYVNQHGKVLAIFTIRKLRQYPLELGTACYIESVYLPDLINVALSILNHLKYKGACNIEFKMDTSDNKLKFIEINPRFWLQVDHAYVCGINFPLIQYLDLTAGTEVSYSTFKEQIKWRDIPADFLALISNDRGLFSICKWIVSFKDVKAYGLFALDDPLPYLHSIEYGRKFLNMFKVLFRNKLRNDKWKR